MGTMNRQMTSVALLRLCSGMAGAGTIGVLLTVGACARHEILWASPDRDDGRQAAVRGGTDAAGRVALCRPYALRTCGADASIDVYFQGPCEDMKLLAAGYAVALCLAGNDAHLNSAICVRRGADAATGKHVTLRAFNAPFAGGYSPAPPMASLESDGSWCEFVQSFPVEAVGLHIGEECVVSLTDAFLAGHRLDGTPIDVDRTAVRLVCKGSAERKQAQPIAAARSRPVVMGVR